MLISVGFFQALQKHKPKSRQLTTEIKEEIGHYSDLGADKKRLKEQLQEKTDIVVLLKDINNIAASLKGPKGSKDELYEGIILLKEKYAKSYIFRCK